MRQGRTPEPGRRDWLRERLRFLASPPAQASPYVTVRHARTHTVLGRRVWIADRGAARRVGLLGRSSLTPGEGVWILPCEAIHTCGMRFAIDLIFLDRKHRICKVRSDVRPWRFSGAWRARSVIELAAGSLAGVDLRHGDLVELLAAEDV